MVVFRKTFLRVGNETRIRKWRIRGIEEDEIPFPCVFAGLLEILAEKRDSVRPKERRNRKDIFRLKRIPDAIGKRSVESTFPVCPVKTVEGVLIEEKKETGTLKPILPLFQKRIERFPDAQIIVVLLLPGKAHCLQQDIQLMRIAHEFLRMIPHIEIGLDENRIGIRDKSLLRSLGKEQRPTA